MGTACALPPEPAASRSNSVTLLRQIQTEIGEASCDGPQQCHSSAVGAKPCGGPDSYLAWSSKSTDATKLQSLLEQHRATRLAENLHSSTSSNCAIVTDPGAHCIAKPKGPGLMCVLHDRQNGGQSAI
ncbi:hypothetical protein LNV08_17275 [Paucibacter sp. TC2R-5]|uniref:hypothetical protein n=1 Tax=Paucibacter sp. TC2R-5 TaxID=2893555 RepID=UPI0021E3983D|nr:hypothetical protein [Paucibacter sp. TC2R-5]MCV2360726.1 hypothetical protein [Paucibacter sp. TC2R-5]